MCMITLFDRWNGSPVPFNAGIGKIGMGNPSTTTAYNHSLVKNFTAHISTKLSKNSVNKLKFFLF